MYKILYTIMYTKHFSLQKPEHGLDNLKPQSIKCFREPLLYVFLFFTRPCQGSPPIADWVRKYLLLRKAFYQIYVDGMKPKLRIWRALCRWIKPKENCYSLNNIDIPLELITHKQAGQNIKEIVNSWCLEPD